MKILGYHDIRKQQNTHFLYLNEIPTGYYVSLPLPTRRFGTPAYVFFASPSSMQPGRPVSVAAPRLWWAIDAQTGQLLLYAQTKILPLSKQQFDGVLLPIIERSLDEQEALLSRLESQLTIATEAFFQDVTLPIETHLAVAQSLSAYLPSILRPYYQALSSDFYEWLFGHTAD